LSLCHYLALIEQKINALDQAAPLVGWRLPGFATLRRLLEARMGKQGKREFVQVLRLMEVFRTDEVAAAVRMQSRVEHSSDTSPTIRHGGCRASCPGPTCPSSYRGRACEAGTAHRVA
jgi:hypothetical protein